MIHPVYICLKHQANTGKTELVGNYYLFIPMYHCSMTNDKKRFSGEVVVYYA